MATATFYARSSRWRLRVLQLARVEAFGEPGVSSLVAASMPVASRMRRSGAKARPVPVRLRPSAVSRPCTGRWSCRRSPARSLASVPRFFVDPAASTALPENRVVRPLLLTTFALNYAVSALDS